MIEVTMNGSITGSTIAGEWSTTLNLKTPIGDINLEGLIYEPKEDITTYELAKLLHLLVCVSVGKDIFDTREFIEKNNLLRHFREV
jgi:hypothetical protein